MLLMRVHCSSPHQAPMHMPGRLGERQLFCELNVPMQLLRKHLCVHLFCWTDRMRSLLSGMCIAKA